MPIFKNMVTCLYCEHLKFEYEESDLVTGDSIAYCKIKNGETTLGTDICVNFNINPGFHTHKWYPNKKDKNHKSY